METFRRTFHDLRLAGFLDPGQALEAAARLLEGARSGQTERLLPAAGLLRQALAFLPLDPGLAAQAERLFPDAPPSRAFRAWFTTVRPLADSGRTPILARALNAWQAGDKDGFLAAVAALEGPALAATAPLLAWGAVAAGEKELAAGLLAAGPGNFLGLNLLARQARERGDREAALDHLGASLDFEPFQPAALVQLAGLARTPARRNRAGLSAARRVHVCLYSWNKLQPLLATLASLAASDLGPARVTVLNNGSTAFSPEELEQAARQAAPGLSPDFVHLPVNVGAPAARNWLWSLPASREADHVAFLDDDVTLPRHWLSSLLETLGEHPGACAAGVRVLQPRPMAVLQYAWRFFAETGDRHIRFTANAPTRLDLGQYDLVRPCLTVMGCCHLLHRGRLEALGAPGFDMRFAPSQVDDIEHDLQIWKAGGRVLFDGRVGVVHHQDSGDPGRRTPLQLALAHANHFKMEHKFTAAELADLDRAVRRADHGHFLACLDTALPLLSPDARAFWEALAPALARLACDADLG